MTTLEVMVRAIRQEADTIHSFELESADGAALPKFSAGAHIDVHLGDRLVRSYSLANAPSDDRRYVIAVHREATGRGGSHHMHEKIRVGQRLRIGEPRNNFELHEAAAHTVFIAGGIGVTPIRSMIHRLEAMSLPWELHYCGRTRSGMAYLAEFEDMRDRGKDVHIHVDAEHAGNMLDMERTIRSASTAAHFYCCGPKPMLAAFQAFAATLPGPQVHVEYFSAREEGAVDGGYVVELARSRKQLAISPGRSILDTLLDAGIPIEFSCMDGICGSCEVRVLAGEPDHRDSVLSRSERSRNDRMMVCCSGSRSPVLVLDL